MTFNGSAETDGSFFIYGGKGVDTLTGGSGADVFFFAEDGRFGAGDHVDGGARPGRHGASRQLHHRPSSGTRSCNRDGGPEVGLGRPLLRAGNAVQLRHHHRRRTVAAGATMTFNGAGLERQRDVPLRRLGSRPTAISACSAARQRHPHRRRGQRPPLRRPRLGRSDRRSGERFLPLPGVGESTATATDRILDFSSGDIIDLVTDRRRHDPVGRPGLHLHGGANSFTGNGHAGELIAVDNGGGIWTVSGDVNGDGVADFQVSVTVADSANSQPDLQRLLPLGGARESKKKEPPGDGRLLFLFGSTGARASRPGRSNQEKVIWASEVGPAAFSAAPAASRFTRGEAQAMRPRFRCRLSGPNCTEPPSSMLPVNFVALLWRGTGSLSIQTKFGEVEETARNRLGGGEDRSWHEGHLGKPQGRAGRSGSRRRDRRSARRQRHLLRLQRHGERGLADARPAAAARRDLRGPGRRI